MLIVISPAKKLDFESLPQTDDFSMPDCLQDSSELINTLRPYSVKELEKLMHLSNNLAQLNHDRYQDWSMPFNPQNAKQAILTFKGDVYAGLNIESFSDEDLSFTQAHLRILSGLYGLLKPLDLMQPYRLEMGTRLENERGKNLYEFWGSQITQLINQQLKALSTDTLLNLASNEYFKSVKTKELNGQIITPVFKEKRDDDSYKIIGIYAKKARGMMSAFILKNQITDVEHIKAFSQAGYVYNPDLSSKSDWVFSREK
ncbi:MAG: peroxide stress protein YaaA [gamma proteobacterium symbiont of Bathyaustriella thionipta]|nr:peroxide stress protein YaaA [gamma proteobacterium symbiont of Bathyaustriella thionipta]MCU7950540.1 peroxide stress protein YaaA [gamma proteobacterium symbiont of Bathyaustriella thionipta]MCU7953904.1 peroxide stress protein YaaA [gamma proteobacterium symbiont of Bathyaustriella thionipta]MCU7957042.1 peroxide stress protein YaaA [gamma proteobacterium symbiont of Bathyaustriella thionipta]MCU7965870.1 peroxide stress protein YaaA [gamma proteobacterium symbiont of Bathyaustriella thio